MPAPKGHPFYGGGRKPGQKNRCAINTPSDAALRSFSIIELRGLLDRAQAALVSRVRTTAQTKAANELRRLGPAYASLISLLSGCIVQEALKDRNGYGFLVPRGGAMDAPALLAIPPNHLPDLKVDASLAPAVNRIIETLRNEQGRLSGETMESLALGAYPDGRQIKFKYDTSANQLQGSRVRSVIDAPAVPRPETQVSLTEAREYDPDARVFDQFYFPMAELRWTSDTIPVPCPEATHSEVLAAGTDPIQPALTPLDAIVEITDASPAPAVIQAGGSVTWTNRTPHPVTLTSDGGLWDAATITPGDSYGLTFTPVGVYGYRLTSPTGSALSGEVLVLAPHNCEEIAGAAMGEEGKSTGS